MNSTIGNYIHFTKSGYLNHGISRDGSYQDWSNILSQRQMIAEQALVEYNKRNGSVSDDALTYLEDSVNFIFNPVDKKSAGIREQVEKYLKNQFKDKIESIDWNHGTVNLVDVAEGKTQIAKFEERKMVMNNNKLDHYELRESVEKFTKKVKELQNLIATKLKDGSITKEERVYLTQQQAALQESFEQAFDGANWKEVAGVTPKFASAKSYLQFKTIANELISAYAAIPPIYLYEGTLWEAIIGAIGATAGEIGLDAVYDIIDKSVIGSDVITVERDYKGFLTNKTMVKKEAGVEAKIAASSQRRKVDVNVQYNDQNLSISAKNIKVDGDASHKFVSVVSNQPLSTILNSFQSNEIYNFVNHYFNIFTLHGKERGDQATLQIKDSDLSKHGVSIMDTYQTMKAFIFFKGLTGTESQDLAQIFAIHNKSNNQFKFVRSSDILQTLLNENRINQISVRYNNTIPINKYYFTQTYIEEGTRPEYIRIANFVQKLHEVKVSASFNMIDVVKGIT